MTLTEPTRSTRAWERRRDAMTAELRREVKAKLPHKRDRRAAADRARIRPDYSDVRVARAARAEQGRA